MKKPRFTKEQHESAAKELKELKNRLSSLCLIVCNSFPNHSKVSREAHKHFNAGPIFSLMCELENEYYKLPDIDVSIKNPYIETSKERR